MRFSKFLISVLLLGITAFTFAGTTGKIAGVVTDSQTGQPLPGVNIVVDNTYLGAASDLDGYYVIQNIPPGSYTLTASMVGYAKSKIVDVRVNIDQTTNINIEMNEEALELTGAITVVAERPVVEKDVAASVANLSMKEIENIPLVNISSVVALQAGIEGSSIRGGSSNEVAWVVDGITLRNERNYTPYNGINFTSVEEVKVQTGGFNAEYGNIRSGVVTVVTKEGKRDKYDFSFLGRYRPATPKHFGHSPNSPDAYWIRPYVDDAVAWVGTKNGGWDEYTQKQYPEWVGFNAKSEELLQNDNPDDDLTPAALQQLFLWEHRRKLDIEDPDYSADMSLGGPVPFVADKLGNLRFLASYRRSRSMYIVPLSDDAYRDANTQLKLTSDVGKGMKLMIDGLFGRETGTNYSRSGRPGIFQSSSGIASEFYNFSYGQGALFGTDYWTPSRVNYTSIGIKFSHVVNDRTFYETSLSRFDSDYDTTPGRRRDTTPIKKFGNNYWVDESPFGLEEFESTTSIINSMRTGAAFSTSRDTSRTSSYNFRFDFTSQLNRYNNLKTGVEFGVTDSDIRYGRQSIFRASNSHVQWHEYPMRGALYAQNKLEFEGMIAQLGLRMDYSYAATDWYTGYDTYDPAFSAKYAAGLDTLLDKKPAKHVITFSPRLAIAFPITVNSKLYFNYGHFRQLPTPENLYLVQREPYSNQVVWLANPNSELQKTVAYELGYEHNLFNSLLIRAAGYYKDISKQPKSVRYSNFDGSVTYSTSQPNSYRDIRGFEITLNKNRGRWVRGFINYTYMVSTAGFFGFDRYYENPATQRKYEREFKRHYQSKPVPRPYARANIDLMTPNEYGPDMSGIKPLANWRMNILADWKAGSYTTWVGGGSVPGIQYNVQWKDYWNLNLRFSKNFRFMKTNVEFFVDIYNVLNIKRLSFAGFYDGTDYLDYMKSLHFSENTEGIEYFSYVNVPGHDQVGDYRKAGVDFVPIVARSDANSVYNPNGDYLYYFANSLPGDNGSSIHGKGYYRYDEVNGTWYQEDQKRVDQILKDKAYIDMPNFQYFTFLNPRNIFWGIKLSFEL